MRKLLFALCLCILLSGCDQQIAKSFGGEYTVTLKEGERLENVTWKKDSLWLLTVEEPSRPPKTYTFRENSVFGVMEGTVRIKEI